MISGLIITDICFEQNPNFFQGKFGRRLLKNYARQQACLRSQARPPFAFESKLQLKTARKS